MGEITAMTLSEKIVLLRGRRRCFDERLKMMKVVRLCRIQGLGFWRCREIRVNAVLLFLFVFEMIP